MDQKPTLIEKELIPGLSFVNKTQVPQPHDLSKKLLDATSLGNIHHGKVSIIFEDDDSIKQVDTTIWCSGRDYICLKGGTWIPVARIHDVIF